jgi:hypothetical protein
VRAHAIEQLAAAAAEPQVHAVSSLAPEVFVPVGAPGTRASSFPLPQMFKCLALPERLIPSVRLTPSVLRRMLACLPTTGAWRISSTGASMLLGQLSFSLPTKLLPTRRRCGAEGAVSALSDLEGDTTAEKAAAYIRELQTRRTRMYQEHRHTLASGLGPEAEATF